jgi:hypothetical protein
VLVDLMRQNSGDKSATLRLAAANAILDRGVGKAAQSVALDLNLTKKLDELSDDELIVNGRPDHDAGASRTGSFPRWRARHWTASARHWSLCRHCRPWRDRIWQGDDETIAAFEAKVAAVAMA